MRALLLLPVLLFACGPVRTPDVPSGPSCFDAEKNGSETDVDCGGDCAACANEKACTAPTECASGDCFQGTCRREADCQAETDDAFCARLGRTCGAHAGLDSCGDRRTVDCGPCPEQVDCSGATTSGLPSGKLLGSLTSAERDTLCDFGACTWGGYGQSVSCGDDKVSGPEGRQACHDELLSCAYLTVGGVESCQLAVAASPCDLFTVIFEDPACDEMRDCYLSSVP